MKNLKLYLVIIACLFCLSMYSQSNTISKQEGHWSTIFSMGYGFLKGSGNPWALEFSAGGNFFFKDNIYAGARIGYLGASSFYCDRYTQIKSKNHLITVPLELGYAFSPENKRWGIVPFIGAGINIGIKGKTEVKDYDNVNHKIGGKIGLDGRIGIRAIISEFVISASYHSPLNSKQEQFLGEDAYPEVSIGWWIDR